jgi:hypothetical protein
MKKENQFMEMLKAWITCVIVVVIFICIAKYNVITTGDCEMSLATFEVAE